MNGPQQSRAFVEPSSFPECPKGKFILPVLPGPSRKLSLIVPTYQEANNIQEFLFETCRILDSSLPGQYEVIVVDDDSPDGTWLRASQTMGKLPGVRVMRRKGERGLASSVIRGYQAAGGEVLGTINADFQHPPSALTAMIEKTRIAEIVVASRFCEGGGTGDWPQDRLLMSRAACQAGKWMLPTVFSELTDPLSGFYLFRRTVIEGIELNPMGFKTLIEILARGRGRSVAECPYEMRSRRSGASKATIESSLSFLLQLRQLQTTNAA
jgi:dolichol-phosphate mannosyltransferase